MRTASETKVTEVAPGITVFFNREQEHSNERWVVSCDKGMFNCPTRREAMELAKAFLADQNKRGKGRPAIGRRVLVTLTETHIETAERIGDGVVSAGVRRALDDAKRKKS